MCLCGLGERCVSVRLVKCWAHGPIKGVFDNPTAWANWFSKLPTPWWVVVPIHTDKVQCLQTFVMLCTLWLKHCVALQIVSLVYSVDLWYYFSMSHCKPQRSSKKNESYETLGYSSNFGTGIGSNCPNVESKIVCTYLLYFRTCRGTYQSLVLLEAWYKRSWSKIQQNWNHF